MLDRGLARALAGARVGARALAAHRQALAVARAAVAAQVDQPLDRHLHFAAQVAFDRQARDAFAHPLHLGVGQVLDLAVRLDAGGDADRLGARAADAVDRGQRDAGVLVVRDVDACNTGHSEFFPGNLKLYQYSQGLIIPLALFVARIACKSPAPRACAARSCICGRSS